MLMSNAEFEPRNENYEAWIESLRSRCGHYNLKGIETKAFTWWHRPQRIGELDAADLGWNADRVERTRQDARRDGMDHYYMIMPLRGETAVAQNDDIFKLSVGDIALVDAARPEVHFGDRRPGLRWLVLNLPRRELASHLGMLPQGGRRSQSETLAGRLLFQLIGDAANDRLSEFDRTEPYLRMVIFDLVGALFSASDADVGLSPNSEKLFRRICKIVRGRFAESAIGPSEIAAEAGISLRYLQKLFTERGLTCGQYIQSHRLAHAARLLDRRAHANTGQPLSEIAYACGFGDYRYFSRAFRRRFGHPPGGLSREDDVI
jgi:AraC family transcriptional regulator, positive regulator of tynA and feaB